MRLSSVVCLAAAVGSFVCAPQAHAEPTGRIIVSLREAKAPRAQASAARAVIASAGVVRAGAPMPQIGALTVRPALQTTAAALRRLRADPRVRAAEPEGRFALRASPNDPALASPEPDGSAPPGTPLAWPLVRANFPAAWDVTTGFDAVVAVLDTGIDGNHPDLQGKVAEALDFDDQTGDSPLSDADGHGTHVSSLACAATNNGIGIAGAGYDCRLLVLKTDLTDSSVARGIIAAADRGAHSLNMSFGDDGGTHSQAIADAIDYAVARNVVMVAAAADEPIEEQGEPSNLVQPTGSGADIAQGKGLSVTAATIDDQRADFAGRGTQISMAAYGALSSSDSGARGLFGLYPGNATPREQTTVVPPAAGCECRASFGGDDRYAFLPGTSMAAPQVAAAAALVRTLNPKLSGLEVVRLLKETARRPSGTGWNSELGWGILDAGAAVDAARRIDRTAPNSRAIARARTRKRAVLVRWRSSDPATAGLIASGIARYEVYRSVDGSKPRLVATTTATRRRFRLRRGRRYEFFTLAVDRAGNREAAPAHADSRVNVRR